MTPNAIKLCQLVEPARILELEPCRKHEALQRLCHCLAQDPRVLEEAALFQAILRREEQISTGIGAGLAIPHVKIPQVRDNLMAIGRIRRGLDFAALDGQPVHLIFMICASDRQTSEFVRILARVTALLKNDVIRQELLEAAIPDKFFEVIRTHER